MHASEMEGVEIMRVDSESDAELRVKATYFLGEYMSSDRIPQNWGRVIEKCGNDDDFHTLAKYYDLVYIPEKSDDNNLPHKLIGWVDCFYRQGINVLSIEINNDVLTLTARHKKSSCSMQQSAELPYDALWHSIVQTLSVLSVGKKAPISYLSDTIGRYVIRN